jgi:glyoxylase-like metal-dependent hydrolase (beta-lactamase superfamily II)
MGPKQVHDGIFLIGDSDLTDSRDCCVYFLNLGEGVLIDTGAGMSVESLIANIKKLGFDKVSTIILTHCHIDHIGGAAALRDHYNARLVMHDRDASPVESGDRIMTAAHWYGIDFQPLSIDQTFAGPQFILTIGDYTVILLHTPGHTPGSISVYLDKSGKRVLFGQDIHGPFLKDFGADMTDWTISMRKLLSLNADILCEGHFGIYRPNNKVTAYIERYLDEYGEEG